jgi:hypothetical protein
MTGWLLQEFFHLLSQEMFSPNYGLFRPGILPYTTEINPYSELIDPDHHLQHVRFLHLSLSRPYPFTSPMYQFPVVVKLQADAPSFFVLSFPFISSSSSSVGS